MKLDKEKKEILKEALDNFKREKEVDVIYEEDHSKKEKDIRKIHVVEELEQEIEKA